MPRTTTSSETASATGRDWIDGEEDHKPVLHLVSCWSLEEPHRIGESAAISKPCVLGRGTSVGASALPRATFARVRPGNAEAQPALSSPRLSREQLRIVPKGGVLEIENLGRVPLWHNGRQVTNAVVKEGHVLTLQDTFVFVVELRPTLLAPVRAYPAEKMRFSFGSPDAFGYVGETAVAWQLRERLALAACATGHVLLQGESGAGKELAVATIHGLSNRAGKALVARNAATFPDTLVDAELFGNRQGYPNSGTPARPGLIGEANGGALFLDEIGELAEQNQAHLLRVLDSGEYQALGESKSARSDFRLYAATNRPVTRLKHDFAARFETRVRIPTLNDRRADIPLIARELVSRDSASGASSFLRFIDETATTPYPRVDPLLMEALLGRTYTHHTRELLQLLKTSANSSRGNFLKLTPEVADALGSSAYPDESPTSAQIQEALAAARGSKAEAARLLGLKNRFALLRLLKKGN